MATTKIWAVKDNISRVLKYASNPNKTNIKDLKQVLKYAENKDKTNLENETENVYLVTGVNCNKDTVYQEMIKVKEKFNKLSGGNTAYHAYQSFKTGEVTPELAHKIGVELAQRMFPEYQVLVTTHINTGTYHNHFVINSVNMFTGEKLNCNKGAYYRFRGLSDELCKKYNLSVIERPKGRTARNIYFAEKRGEPTKYNLMRKAIDLALEKSVDMVQFKRVLRKQGYILNDDFSRKYATIKAINDAKATRLYRLGEKYDIEKIKFRLLDNPLSIQKEYKIFIQTQINNKKELDFLEQLKQQEKEIEEKGLLVKLVELFLYLLGIRPFVTENNEKIWHAPLSPTMKMALKQMNIYSEQAKLLVEEKIETKKDLENYIKSQNTKINDLKANREKIRNKLRNCTDEIKKLEYKENRNKLTTKIDKIRRKIKLAEKLKDRTDEITEKIRYELQMMEEEKDRELKEKQKNKKERF